MSSIAVFLILGGATAFAAKKIGTSQLKANAVTTGKIKKEAVTTAKIKKDAVTGAKVKESTLGQVPSALSATNAGNASTVDGQTANKIFKTLTEGQTGIPVATVGGFSITASCNVNDADVAITPPSGVGSVLNAGGEAAGSNQTTFDYESNKIGQAFGIRLDELSESALDATYGISSVALATSTGVTVSGVIGYDYDTFNNEPPNTCVVYGHLLAG
jgi:hypothetical protein